MPKPLKGKQKNIDFNKNGVLDDDDLKVLKKIRQAYKAKKNANR